MMIAQVNLILYQLSLAQIEAYFKTAIRIVGGRNQSP